jgi:hypothetical protein
MFDFLRSINLSPMEWSHAVELTGEGSPYIGQVVDAALDNAAAIVVLITPDEIAYLHPQYGHATATRRPSPRRRLVRTSSSKPAWPSVETPSERCWWKSAMSVRSVTWRDDTRSG